MKEIKQEARFKVEALMGLFDFIEEKNKILSLEKQKQKEQINILQSILLKMRTALREKKEFELADKIRDILKKTGVTIGDEKV